MFVVYLPAYLLRLSIFVQIYYIVVVCPPSQIPRNIFIELIKFAILSVEFSFVNIIYRQIDGVAIRSLVGSALANISWGFMKRDYCQVQISWKSIFVMLTIHFVCLITKLGRSCSLTPFIKSSNP